jgi:hypothetical protein
MSEINESWKDGKQIVWDATSLSLFEACPRKYQLKMIEGWKPHRTSVHLRFGSHYATALEHYHKRRFEGRTIEEATRDVVHEALIDTWDQVLNEDGTVKSEGPWDSGNVNKTRETLIRTIIWYIEEYRNEDAKILTLADGRPAVEYSFLLPVDNGIYFSGHLDSVVEYGGDNYVRDQKTTKSTVGTYYFEDYKPHIQMSMYSFAGSAILASPVKGVVIDAAQIAVGFSRFSRGFTFRSDAELNEWYADSLKWIEIAHGMSAAMHFPMNPNSCGSYGGCEFRRVCSRGKSVREQFLLADFTPNQQWNPAARR